MLLVRAGRTLEGPHGCSGISSCRSREQRPLQILFGTHRSARPRNQTEQGFASLRRCAKGMLRVVRLCTTQNRRSGGGYRCEQQPRKTFWCASLCPAAQSDGAGVCAPYVWRVRGPARFDPAQSGSIQAAAPQLCHRKITCTDPPDGSDARNDPLRPSGCDRTVPLHDRGMHGSDGCNGSPWTGTPDTSRTCRACWSG